MSHFTFLISRQSVREKKDVKDGTLTVTHTVPKKTYYVAQSLTRFVVSPNAQTERRESGSVEVAYNIERVGPTSGLLEVKQQYISRSLCRKALSDNKDEIRLKTTFLVDVSLLRPQRSFSQVYFQLYSIVYFIFYMLQLALYFTKIECCNRNVVCWK